MAVLLGAVVGLPMVAASPAAALAPSTVTVTLNPSTIQANGTDTSAVTIEVKDAANQPVTDATVTIQRTGDSKVSSVTNQGGGIYTAKITASLTPGTETIRATASNVLGSQQSAPVTLTELGAPTSMTLSLSPARLAAGGAGTSLLTATLKDVNNKPTPGHTVNLSVTNGPPVTFSHNPARDNGDGTYTSTVTAAATAGTTTITAFGGGKSAQTDLVNYGAPTSATLVLNPTSVVANGAATSIATATFKDANGNAVPGQTVTISSDGDAGIPAGPATDNGDGTYTKTITASTTAATETIKASNGTIHATAPLEEKPGPATSVVLALDPASIVADGVATSTAKVTVKDTNGNFVKDENVTLVKSNGSDVTVGAVSFNSDDNTYRATITSSTTAGTQTITATATKANRSSTASTLTETPGKPHGITLTFNPTSITADGSSTTNLKAVVADKFGNRVPGQTLTLTKDGDTTLVSGPTDAGNGEYQWNFKASTTAGKETFTVKTGSGADQVSQTAQLTELAGPPTQTNFNLALSSNTVTADGVATVTATATVKDANGNPVTGQTVTISKATGNDVTVGQVTEKGDTPGTYVATITSSKTVGTNTITAAITGRGISDSETLTEVAGSVASVIVSLSKTTMAADKQDTATVTATVADANGNPVLDGTVTFSTSGDVTFGATTNHNNGTYSATVTSSLTPGAEQIRGTATSPASPASKTSDPVTLHEFGPAKSYELSLTPESIYADGIAFSTAKVTLKDAQGNPVGLANVAITTRGDTTVGSVTNNGDGTYTARITSSKTPGTDTVDAFVDGVLRKSATLTEYGPANTVAVTLDPATIVADGAATSVVTATITDTGGRAVLNDAPAFLTNGDVTFGPVTNNGDGTYTSTLKASKTAGPETITSRAKNFKTGNATITEVAGPATSVALALDPTSVVADGAATSLATATVRDANNNAVRDAVVSFTTTRDVTFSPVTNKGDGTYTSTIKASKTAGLETITAAVAATGASGQAVLTETAGPASKVTLNLSPSIVTANGVAKSTATARVLDANDNLVDVDAVTMATDGDAAVGPVTKNADGTHTSTITASTTPGQETITATAGSVSGTAVLTEVSDGAVTITVTLDPATIVADGSDVSTATATVEDPDGNPIDFETVTFATNGDVTFGPVTNNGDGSYETTVTASTTAGAELITATGEMTGQSGSATLVEKADRATSVALTLTPSTVTANGVATSAAKAVVTDANGNPVLDEIVTITRVGDSKVGTVTNKGDGSYTATVTASKTAGTETFTATATKAAVASDPATLTEVEGPLAQVALTLAPATVTANRAATSTATATVKDAVGNVIKDANVVFTTTGDTTFSPVTNHGDGRYTSTITSSRTAGTETIKATATKGSASAVGQAVLTETPGPAHAVSVTLNPSSIVANGRSTSIATAVVTDANGNRVVDQTISFARTGDTTLGTPVRQGDGSYTVTITSSRTVGTSTIQATATPSGRTGSAFLTETAQPGGYWLASATGEVLSFGAAPDRGALSGAPLNQAVVAMVAHPDDNGYWLVARDGGIFAFGSARFLGSMGGQPLNQPIVGMAPTGDGGGYWLVGADGGIFAFGSARFHGSMGGVPLNQPVVGMSPTPGGDGYYLVAADGGIFAFGDAKDRFHGSMGGTPLNSPVVGMSPTPTFEGYYLVARDGGIFAFGDASGKFYGSMGGKGIDNVVGISGTTSGSGYRIFGSDGGVYGFGDGVVSGDGRGRTGAPIVGGDGF